LQHGLLDSSGAWVLNDPSEGLAYLLADNGFDVWLGNSRGNYYSPVPNDTKAAWSFTYDDMAQYDIPAILSYVTQTTGQSQVAYVGHSQGTTQMFAAASLSADVRAKLSIFVALAPAAYVQHQTSFLVSLMADLDIDQILLLFGGKSFLPETPLMKIIAQVFCGPSRCTEPFCEDVIFALCGKNSNVTDNLNSTKMEVYVSHTPAGTSVLNMAHWAQAVRKGKFQMYDFGQQGNMQRYHQPNPPQYDLSKIQIPVAIFSGGQDALADPQDVKRLVSELPSSSIVYQGFVPDYQHLDFTWGINARSVIYGEVLSLLQRYGQGVANVGATA